MDIAAYISELLKQYGELTIPGLGRFARMRVHGYYDQWEEVMYPPSYRLSFDPNVTEDDQTVVNHISSLKNISVSSSQYFLEKFVNNIKEETSHGSVPFDDLGYFYRDGNGVLNFTFKNEDLTKDEGFYGFAPLKLSKVKNPVVVDTPVPTAVPVTEKEPETIPSEPIAETHEALPPAVVAASAEEAATEQPASGYKLPQDKALTLNDFLARKKHKAHESNRLSENLTPETSELVNEPVETEELVAEEKETRSAVNVWVILIIIVAVSAGALFGLYKYDPTLFDKLGRLQSKHDTTAVAAKPKPTPAVDTTVKAVPTVDTVKKPDTGKTAAATTAQPATQTAAKTDTVGTKPAPKTNTNVIAEKPAKTEPNTTAPATEPVATKTAPVAHARKLDANGNSMAPHVAQAHYEIFGGSFNSMEEAEKSARAYRSLSTATVKFNPKIMKNASATRFRITLGTFNTRDEAKAAANKLISTKKVSEIDLSIEPYSYKIK
jgi:hypothetical protein